MLKDQADGAAVPPAPGLSTDLSETHARYPGSAHSARPRHAAPTLLRAKASNKLLKILSGYVTHDVPLQAVSSSNDDESFSDLP